MAVLFILGVALLLTAVHRIVMAPRQFSMGAGGSHWSGWPVGRPRIPGSSDLSGV